MPPASSDSRVLSTHRLPNPIRFAALCGKRDLLAVVHASWDVSVCRIVSGQVAFTIRRRDECEATALEWRDDGALLAVAWTDGTYVLYDGERGTVLGNGRVEVEREVAEDDWRLDLRPDFGPDDDDEEGAGPKISRFGWEQHFVAGQPSDGLVGSKRSIEAWAEDVHDRLEGEAEESAATLLSALTGAITRLDVTKVLPRLSAIPPHGMPLNKAGPTGGKFATLAATDSVFETQDSQIGLVNNLLVCQDDGVVQVFLDETIKIGVCNIGAAPLMHATHSSSPYHAVLTRSAESDLQVSLLHLPLQTLSGSLLHVIATNTKRVQDLVDYTLHSLRCIEHDFVSGLQFPTRLLNSFREMLSENDEGDPSLNLYHLAMTGDFSAPVLEWLTDIVKDTNYKRWDAAVGSMYANIRDHLFINLLPALDRMTIAASELRGLATFHEGSSKFDCAPALFTNLLAAVDCLRLAAEMCLRVAIVEQKQFRTFSRWLKVQIDIGTAEPFSTSALETEEREMPSIDYCLVRTYIRDTMTRSRLAGYVTTRSELQRKTSKADFFADTLVKELTFDNAKNVLESSRLADVRNPTEEEEEDTVGEGYLPLMNLPAIGAVLRGHVRAALESITLWQSRMLDSPSRFPLNISDEATPSDLALLGSPSHSFRGTASAAVTVQLLTIPTADAIPPCVLEIHSLSLAASPVPARDRLSSSRASLRNMQPTQDMQQYVIPLPGRVLDAKFLPSSAHISSFPPPSSAAALSLFRADDDTRNTLLYLHTMLQQEPVALHTFPPEAGFAPQSMLVGGRPGKHVVVVVGNRGREWVVVDIESALTGINATPVHSGEVGREDVEMVH